MAMRFTIRDETVHALIAYDPITGHLTWKADRGKVKAGDPAGSASDSHGYLSVRVNYRSYLAHRLAWFLTHGEFPKNKLDHINGDRHDNRLANLREVSDRDNARNSAMNTKNTSGVVGVSWHAARGKWRANITVGRQQKHLGLFDSFDEAVAVRRQAEAEFDFHPNHGRTPGEPTLHY